MTRRFASNRKTWLPIALLACGLASGCASSGKDLTKNAQSGPVVINPRSEPSKIELTRFLQAKEPHQFLAEIQDFSAPVTEAKVTIEGTPLEVPLQKIGGTTWRGELNSEQLKRLAISGKTIEYKARIVARDQKGVTGASEGTIEVKVAAPTLDADAG